MLAPEGQKGANWLAVHQTIPDFQVVPRVPTKSRLTGRDRQGNLDFVAFARIEGASPGKLVPVEVSIKMSLHEADGETIWQMQRGAYSLTCESVTKVH